MSTQPQSQFLLAPPEIRQLIYTFLLDDGGCKWIAIRNKPVPNDCRHGQAISGKDAAVPSTHRSRYYVRERTSMFHQRCFETTYHIASDGMELHTEVMGVCRLLYTEAADMLYRRHFFDFGYHVQAVVPFLSDLSPHTRSLVESISVCKRGPIPSLGFTSERNEWSYMCRFLSQTNTLRSLRIVVETGRPARPWDGVQELSASDIRLLTLIGHDNIEWIGELAQLKSLEEVGIVPEVKHLPLPESSAMSVYAALSASVEKGLVEFLRSEMPTSCIKSSILAEGETAGKRTGCMLTN